MSELFKVTPSSVEKQQGGQSEKKNIMNRRDFLKKAGGFIAAATLVAGGVNIFDEESPEDEEQTKKNVLDKVGVSEEGDKMPKEEYMSEQEKSRDILDTDIEGVSEKAKDIARELRRVFGKVIGEENFTPEKLLNDDFYIAIQLREAKYDNNKESNKGAVGVMQNTPISIEDLMRIMEKDYELFLYNGKRTNESERGQIAKEMLNIVKADKSGDFSRIFGKLYLMILHKEYGIGKEAVSDEDFLDAQERIASSYNGGVTQGKRDKEHWHRESKKYAEMVRGYMDTLKVLSLEMSELKTNDNSSRMLIVKRLFEMTEGREYMRKIYLDKVKKAEGSPPKKISKERLKVILSERASA